MTANVTDLLLGPILRYAGTTTATVWVETSAANDGRGARP